MDRTMSRCNDCDHYEQDHTSAYCHKCLDRRNDLISRQDAISAIMSEPMNEPRYPSWFAIKIELLPSADITATEFCQKCQETTERVLNNQGEKIKRLSAEREEEKSEQKA